LEARDELKDANDRVRQKERENDERNDYCNNEEE